MNSYQENSPLLTSISMRLNCDVENTSNGKVTSQSVNESNRENGISKNRSSKDINNDLPKDSVIKVYKRRWYILFLTAMIVFLQNYLTNTWPVIAVSIKPIFGWSNATISLMQNWFSLMFLIFIFPFSWILEVKGIRISMILTAGCVFAATVVRCISFTPPAVSWLNNIGDILIGVAQPVVYIIAPIISAVWFPPKERATTTSLIISGAFLGYAACFLIDPLFASTPILIRNGSRHHPFKTEYSNLGIIKTEILHGRIMECVVCGLTFLAILIYFPNKPPKPPSRSSALPKFDFVYGLKSLFKSSYANFWLMCATNAISTAIYSTWLSLITINFRHFMTQTEIGYLGCVANIMGSVAALVVGRLGDVFRGRRKLILMICVCLAVFSTFWILLISMKYISFSTAQLYIAMILQATTVIGPCGIMVEMAVESNYPIDETVTALAIFFVYNMLPIPFLLVFLIPNIGTSWMNWFIYISLIFCVPLVYFFQDRNRRLAVDRRKSLTIAVESDIKQTISTTVA